MLTVLRKLFRWLKRPPPAEERARVTQSGNTVLSATSPVDRVPSILIDRVIPGLNRDGTAEALQIATIDAEGTVLHDALSAPMRNTAWPEAQAVSTPVDSAPPIFIDTETTGLNRDGTDEVLEIAIVDVAGTVLLDTLVRPMRKTTWPEAQAVHGISPDDVGDAPSWGELLPKIAAICTDRTVVFYNAPFDMSFFPADFFPSACCAMRRYIEVNPDRNTWVELADAAAESGYSSRGAYHRALQDARACRHVWLFGITRLEKTYPRLSSPSITAELDSESDTALPLVFDRIFPEQLRFVAINDRCRLWTTEDRDEINVYRPRTVGGIGKIATLRKADNRELTRRLMDDVPIALKLRERCDDALAFDVCAVGSGRRR